MASATPAQIWALGAQRERERIARLADEAGATYRTGISGRYQCAANCPHAGIGNQVDGHGSHLHPFSELIGSQA